MRVVSDPPKARANLLKHDIRFSDAEGALFDPNALTREDPAAEGEGRGDDSRLISARRATRKERRQYEAGV